MIAEGVVNAAAEHHRRAFDIVVIGLDGSPSSGVRFTGRAPSWGGCPDFTDGDYVVLPGTGVWMEELKACLEDRGIRWP